MSHYKNNRDMSQLVTVGGEDRILQNLSLPVLMYGFRLLKWVSMTITGVMVHDCKPSALERQIYGTKSMSKTLLTPRLKTYEEPNIFEYASSTSFATSSSVTMTI